MPDSPTPGTREFLPPLREAWYIGLTVLVLAAWCFAPTGDAHLLLFGISFLLSVILVWRTIRPLGSRRKILGSAAILISISVAMQFYVARAEDARLRVLLVGFRCTDATRILHGGATFGRSWKMISDNRSRKAVSYARGPFQSSDLFFSEHLDGDRLEYWVDATDDLHLAAISCPRSDGVR